jgi:D-alanyl-D-alanine-carboxypeptidase/D-alanyl-D-alanine-endopeptidase
MVLLVVHGDQVSFRAYGQSAPNSHQLPTDRSLLRLDSLTKVFTADLLNKLVLARIVRLADLLQRHAPAGIVVPARVHPITLLDLATHTSGLPREIGNAPPGPQFTYPDYRTRWTWLANQHLHSIPGTAALYSNVAFDFLADALQSAAHEPYPRLLAEHTLNPLQMHATTFYPDAEQCRRLLASAFDDGPCAATAATDGSAGLYSTAADMALWLKYLLRTGVPAQDPGAQAVYLQPSSLVRQQGLDHAGEPTGIGLAWIHILPLDSPSHIVEKTGGGAGFQTYIAIDHARRTAVFFAATDGPVGSPLNRFKAANELLLAISGLPPFPPSEYKNPFSPRLSPR